MLQVKYSQLCQLDKTELTRFIEVLGIAPTDFCNKLANTHRELSSLILELEAIVESGNETSREIAHSSLKDLYAEIRCVENIFEAYGDRRTKSYNTFGRGKAAARRIIKEFSKGRTHETGRH